MEDWMSYHKPLFFYDSPTLTTNKLTNSEEQSLSSEANSHSPSQ